MAVETSDYINGCRNYVWLSGYARREEDGSVLLLQSGNEEKAIPIQMAPHLRCPPPSEAFNIKCHVFSERTEANDQRVWLEAYFIKRASASSVPKPRAVINALRKHSAISKNPFASYEEVIVELQEQQGVSKEAIDYLIPRDRKLPRGDGFLNRVLLTGALGHHRFIEPEQGSFDDFGALVFELLQGEDRARAHRILIPGAGRQVLNHMGKRLCPLSVEAQLKVEPILAEDGTVRERRLSLESSFRQGQIGIAQRRHFAGQTFPVWYREALDAQAEAQAQSQTQQRSPSAPAAAPPDGTAHPVQTAGANAPSPGTTAAPPSGPGDDDDDALVETWDS